MKNFTFVFITVFILLLFAIDLFAGLNDDLFYSLEDLTLSKYENYDVVKLKGCNFSTMYIGAPDLPATTVSFLIPQDKKVTQVNFINVERIKVPGAYNIIPKQPPRLTDGSPLPPFVEPEPWYYFSGLPYPPLQYEIIEDGFRSEYRTVTLRIYPLVYIPLDKSLWLSTHIQMGLELEQDVNWGVPVKRRSEISLRTIENLIRTMVVNPEDVDGYGSTQIEEGKSNLNKLEITDSPSLQGGCVDYIIITSDALKQSFQELADWKTSKGIVSLVKSLSWIDEHYTGSDRQARIRNFVKNAHSNWGTDYFLLGGDTDILPIRTVKASGLYFPECPSDLYYSDLEGTWNENCNSIFGELPIYVDILGLNFVDKDNGWCISPTHPIGIFKTFNGGINWETQDGAGYAISAVSVDSAWIVGYAKILRTTNGGKDWETQSLPPAMEEKPLNAVYFRSSKEGWVAGNRYIIHTSDAGLNWEIQYDFGGIDSTFEDVQFVDDMNGWAVGHYDNSVFSKRKPLIFHTSNGGAEWFSQRDTHYERLYGIYVVDALEVWAVGDSSGFNPQFTKGLILHTIDGGLTWTKQTFNGLFAFTDIIFVSALEGWVSNIEGKLYHTTDGGNFWYEKESFPVTLKGIDFFGLQDGWTAGGDVCLHTTNAGAGWTEFHFPQLGDTSTQEYEPDVFVARAPAKNVKQVETFTNKVLCYEKNPPIDNDYLNKILFLGADLGFGNSSATKEKFQKKNWYPTEFFHKYEMYGPKDGGTPPNDWHGDELISRTATIDEMNMGYHFINHMDHSGPYIMGTYYINGEQITRNDVDDLHNGNRTSIIWTYGCSAGAFQYDGICEHFMNNPNGGAVGFIGNVRSGCACQWNQDFRFFKSIFGDNNYNLGVAFSTTQGPAFLFPNSVNMHLLGDPEMPVWTDNPKPLQVIKPEEIVGFGTHTITIKVMDPSPPVPQPIQGTFVCLQKEDEAYARKFTDENGEATFTYKPESAGEINVTVTAQNYLPYEGIITVNPSAIEEPYICFDSEIIDDDNAGSSIGNSDGIVNPGETIEMDIILKNNGDATASNVSAVLSIPGGAGFVTIIEDEQGFGNILPNETSQSLGPYVFDVSPNCPAGYEIGFHLNINSNQWEDDFVVKVLADSLIQTRHTIAFDDVNGNGIIDPDEEVYIDSLEITNYGEGGADNVEATLTTTDPRVVITDGNCSIDDIPGFSYVTIPPEVEPHCFVFYCIPEVPGAFDFTLTLKDGFGREWQQKMDLSAPNPPDSVWPNLFGQDFSNLIWDYVNVSKDFDISGYNVYCSFSNIGTFERVNRLPRVSFSLFNDFPLCKNTEYSYKLRSVDSSGNESGDSPILHTKTNPPFLQGWPKIFPKVTDGNWSSAKVGDIDGDGDMEIVMGYGNYVFAYHHDGTIVTGWPKDLDYESYSTPALADLDGDGTLEIIYCGGENESLYVWKHDGQKFSNQWPLWFEDQYVKGSPLIADLESDGIIEIIVCVDNKVYAYHPDGSLASENWGTVSIKGNIDVRFVPSIADLDGDGLYEVIVASFDGEPSYTGYIYVFDHYGNLFNYGEWPFTFENNKSSTIVASPSVADFDGDDKQEVLIGNVIPGKVFLIDNDGTLLWEKYLEKAVSSTPGIADCNGDGKLDIFFVDFAGQVGSEVSDLYVVEYENGNSLLEVHFDYIIRSSPTYDGKRIIVTTSDGKVHFLDMEGAELLGSPYFNGQPGDIYSTPSIYDIDLDGDMEITYSGIDKRMYIWDASAIMNESAAVWNTFKHDNWNTGNYDFVVPETYSTTDELATAYNNQRKIADKEEISVVYSSLDKVFFSTSKDGNRLGQRWIIGDGRFPALSKYSDATGTEKFLGAVWVNGYRLDFSRYTETTAWSVPWHLVEIVGIGIHYSPPSLMIDDEGYGHLAWEKITEPLHYPGDIKYELHYSKFDAKLEQPVFIEDEILDEATEYVNEWIPGYVSASLDLDDNNNPVVIWSRSIGEGKNIVYCKQKAGGAWPDEPEIVSSPSEISHHPFCDIMNVEIEVVWENEGIIKHRQRPLTGDWGTIYTVSNPQNYSRSPQILDGDVCIYTEVPQLQPDHYSNVVYRMRLGDGNWLPSQILESTPHLSEYPQGHIEDVSPFGRILHTVWTEGKEAPYEVRYKETILPLQFSGHIVENAIWDADIYITGDVVIDPGITLTINPGVNIMFAPLYDDQKLGIDDNRCELIVEGTLDIIGTESDSIYFTSAGLEPHRNDWYGIRFNSSDISLLNYVNLAYAKTGISYGQNSVAIVENSFISNNYTGLSATQSSPTIRKCTIANNSSGIYCSNCTNVIIDSCQITNDRSMGLDLKEIQPIPLGGPDSMPVSGTGITFSNCDGVTVTNNTLINDYVGVYASGYLNGVFENNYVEDNEWHGFDIAVTKGSNMQFIDNTFINNAKYPVNHNMAKSYYREFAGLSLAFANVHTGETDVLVQGNTFEGNTCGTRFSKYYANPSTGTYNVRYEGNVSKNNFYGFALSAPSGASGYKGTFVNNTAELNDSAGVFIWFGIDSGTVNLGNLTNADSMDDGGNHILNNAVWEVMNNCPYKTYAQGNLWGTTDALEIDSKIYDDEEKPENGEVDFSGYYVAGRIQDGDVWEGLVSVCGDILVPENATLNIVEGTTVRFAAGYDINNIGVDEEKSEMIVEGNVEVKPNRGLSRSDLTGSSRFSGLFGLSGSKEMNDGPPVHTPILFTSDAYEPSPSDWYGIEMGGLDTESRPETKDIKPKTKNEKKIWSSKTPTIFSPLKGENKRKGDRGDAPQREVSYFEVEYAKRGLALCEGENLSMKECAFTNNETGLKLRGYSYVTVKDCIFKGNTNSGILIGEGISGTIKDDSLYDNGTGINLQATQANPFDKLRTGDCDYPTGDHLVAALFKVRNSSLDLKGLYVSGNNTGILCGGQSSPDIKQSKVIDNLDYGVYITDDAEPNLGGSGHNYICGNGTYDLCNNTPNRILSKKNYWGTMNIDTVEAHIYDYYDDNSLGIVEIEPLWNGNKAIGGTMSSGRETTSLVFSLKSISPNPFTSSAIITYSIPKSGRILLTVYDITGRCIKVVQDKTKEAGIYSVSWNGSNNKKQRVSCGVYFVKLSAGDYVTATKIIMLR